MEEYGKARNRMREGMYMCGGAYDVEAERSIDGWMGDGRRADNLVAQRLIITSARQSNFSPTDRRLF